MKQEKISGGVHTVQQLLEDGSAHRIFVADNKKSKNVGTLVQLAITRGISVETVALYEIDIMLPGVRHQGIAAVSHVSTKVATWQDAIANSACPLLLILDSVQDPHNLGACLRSALAAGVDAVLIPNSRAADITPVVEKVACGATEILPIYKVSNLRREVEQMQKQGIWVIGGVGDANQLIYTLDLTLPLAIVVGNEGEGIRHGLREQCDYLAAIPMNAQMESLNVSVACALLLFEVRRQRLFL
ncbi:MAG: 23S rRNA (guanosine(2251)-2'-O)-methyltransferase RlmB [Cardiobacteriaceae bacterium]|nr:23S rRNA (guanosine(2251)-2'-O)-methyltransferase RlmB [Cardiobacteriaceae bacterium]